MKKYLLSIAMMLLSVGVFAQEDTKRPERGEGQKPDMTEAQFKQICKGLQLQDARAAELKKVYVAFVEELQADKFRPVRKNEETTEEDIETMLKAKLEAGVHIAEVRLAYYEKFRKILTASEVAQMFEIEKRIIERVEREIESRRQGKPGEGRPGEGGKDGRREGGNPPQRK